MLDSAGKVAKCKYTEADMEEAAEEQQYAVWASDRFWGVELQPVKAIPDIDWPHPQPSEWAEVRCHTLCAWPPAEAGNLCMVVGLRGP